MQISAYTDTGRVRSTNQDYIMLPSRKPARCPIFYCLQTAWEVPMQEITLPVFWWKNW